jgi:hypothetical protein
METSEDISCSNKTAANANIIFITASTAVVNLHCNQRPLDSWHNTAVYMASWHINMYVHIFLEFKIVLFCSLKILPAVSGVAVEVRSAIMQVAGNYTNFCNTTVLKASTSLFCTTRSKHEQEKQKTAKLSRREAQARMQGTRFETRPARHVLKAFANSDRGRSAHPHNFNRNTSRKETIWKSLQ